MIDRNNHKDISFIRGFMGPGHTRGDVNNLSNRDNINSASQIIEGIHASAAYDYLLNMGFTSLGDAKSMGFFNNSNAAAMISHYRALEEVHDDKTIELSRERRRRHRPTWTNVSDVFEKRHSVRQFTSHTMESGEFSEIVRLSFGLASREMLYDGVVVPTRHYGSGGGLYPVETIIVVNDVGGVDAGVYRYQPYSHTMQPLGVELNIGRVFEHGSFDLEHYSFTVLYKYDMNRNIEKYGELALAITFIEVGLMSQSLCLAYTAFGYSGCQVAGYDKHYCERQLGLDGINSHIVFADICGYE